MKKRVHVYVSGRVQGVAFRAYTRQTAKALNITGWVRNLPDGRVEAVFEGRAEDVEAMTTWCRQGPSHAIVQHLDVREEPFWGEDVGFEICI